MPEIKNTFLKSKMNKDLDDRLIPNGEYRDAQNLQISRSEGSSVGEFENIPGNLPQGYLNSGSLKNTTTGVITSYAGNVIGQHTDEANGNIFIFSTSYTGTDQQPRDITVYTNPVGATIGDSIALYDVAGVLLSPLVLGVEIGMALWGAAVDGATTPGDIYVTAVSNTAITISWNPGGIGTWPLGTAFTIGWCNTIHRWNIDGTLDLLVRGSFLNFSTQSKIYGTNLIEGLLFWTDNRNQPRRINVDSAIANGVTYYTLEDQISVAKYYPYEVPLVLNQNIHVCSGGGAPGVGLRGYDLTMTTTTGIKIGDIVTGFTGQGAQELWEVIYISGATIRVYNNFLAAPTAAVGGLSLTFSRPTMTNESEVRQENGFDTTCTVLGPVAAGAAFTVAYSYNNIATDPTPQPTPKVGDYITSLTMTGPSGVGITIADEVIIQSITTITPGTSIVMTLTKPITVNLIGNDVVISANPNYNNTFTGDPDLIEEKFVRFSYRFKFIDNEYSLSAPFSQICFIPKQEGIFGGGPNESGQDMVDAYTSTIIGWFENRVNNIGLKIPLPQGGDDPVTALASLENDYQVEAIEILYRESDGLSTKILESLSVAEDIKTVDIAPIPNTSTTQFYYTFDYKSVKPYKTLPTNQETRVYDKVPIKALAQEVIANRVTYGNFVENHTPPASLDYSASYNDKSLAYNNYIQYPNHSVKQNRNYQVGFILGDRYGRQSSVVLSSNDNDPTANGSTIYVPYKDWTDVQTSALSTYEWLGSCLRVIVNNGITQTTKNEQTGEPGLYKAYSDTSVDEIEINNGGVGYAAGDIITTQYPAANVGLGSGLTYEVITVALGVITGVKIVTRGSGYANGQTLNQNTATPAGGTGAQITITVNSVNVLGWQSYKFAVKQQEQEYYNVYLPGFVSGYPVTTPKDRGRVAFASILSDNINKVPRDLNEVGPLQNEFTASVELYGRVNNPSINNNQKGGPGTYYYENITAPWNCQYFPGRLPDEAVTVGPIGLNGLELANSPFEVSAAQGPFLNELGASQLPWGIAGAEQSFFNVEQNPLAAGIKIGAEEAQPNLTQPTDRVLFTLGAWVTGVANPPAPNNIGCMIPFLSVSETAPVESELEIFWESSTSGDFVELNQTVLADYAGVSGVSATTASFAEDDTNPTAILQNFKFRDSAGNNLVLDGVPVITQILDNNGNDVTVSSPFIIQQYGPGVVNRDWEILTNQLFWYGAASLTKASSWSISFQTSYSCPSPCYLDTLTNAITLTLTNVAPDTLSFNSVTDGIIGCSAATTGFTTLSTSFGTFTGKNGSIDTLNDTEELCWTLALTSAPGGSTAVFGIDGTTGVVTKTSGTLVNGTYRITATLTDAAAGCVTSVGSLSSTCWVDIVVGTPDTDRAICFGETSAMGLLDTSCAAGTGLPLEVFFGVSGNVTQGTTTAVIGSKTDAYLSTLPAPAGSGSTSYTTTSGGGLNLRYYNVKTEALAAWVAPFYCFPGPAPAFTTGALSQGIMTVIVNLEKAITATSADFQTNFTILYRANSGAAWQLATDSSSVVVGNFNALNVTGAGSAKASLTYQFDTPGEYAVRTNGVQNIGSPGCGLYPAAPSVTVEFYDSTENPTTPGWVDACTNCTGPL